MAEIYDGRNNPGGWMVPGRRRAGDPQDDLRSQHSPGLRVAKAAQGAAFDAAFASIATELIAWTAGAL
jgi:hypothetical protein